MKTLILFFTVMMNAGFASSQTPVLPGSPNTSLPSPKNLKVLQPADLSITNLQLTEAKFDGNLKAWTVKVSVTIKNSGQLVAPKFIIKAMAQKTTPATSGWKDFGYTIAFIPLKPGESATKEFLFIDRDKIMGSAPSFNFKLLSDIRNEVAESNENNNSSVSILISSSN
jgi:subtilase family serine protease